MPRLKSKVALAIKTETTQGSGATMAATDFLICENVKLKPVAEMLKRTANSSSFDTFSHVLGTRYVEVSFRTEVKGSGAAGTAYAPLGAAFLACGYTETISAGVSVTYAPTSNPASGSYFSAGKSCGIEVFMDGIKHTVNGSVGNVKGIIQAGKLAYYEFTFKGKYSAATDVAAGTQTYVSTVPPMVESAAFAIQSFAAIIENFEWNKNNVVAMRPDANSAGSMLGFMVTDHSPEGSFDPEVELVATHPFIANLISGAEGNCTIKVGATAGNITTFTFPKTQYNAADYEDRNGIMVYKMPLQFNRTTGDDFMSIVLT